MENKWWSQCLSWGTDFLIHGWSLWLWVVYLMNFRFLTFKFHQNTRPIIRTQDHHHQSVSRSLSFYCYKGLWISGIVSYVFVPCYVRSFYHGTTAKERLIRSSGWIAGRKHTTAQKPILEVLVAWRRLHSFLKRNAHRSCKCLFEAVEVYLLDSRLINTQLPGMGFLLQGLWSLTSKHF